MPTGKESVTEVLVSGKALELKNCTVNVDASPGATEVGEKLLLIAMVAAVAGVVKTEICDSKTRQNVKMPSMKYLYLTTKSTGFLLISWKICLRLFLLNSMNKGDRLNLLTSVFISLLMSGFDICLGINY